MLKRVRQKRVNRQQLMLSDTEVEILRDWQFSNRIPTLAAAIRAALRVGLEKELNSDIGPHFRK